jgi:hypothetical protein
MRNTDSLDEAWHYMRAVHNLFNNTTATAYNHNRNPKVMRMSELNPQMSGICDKGIADNAQRQKRQQRRKREQVFSLLISNSFVCLLLRFSTFFELRPSDCKLPQMGEYK